MEKSRIKDIRFVASGKKGGSSTSEAKRISSRLNGRRGGRKKSGRRLLVKATTKESRLDLRAASPDDLKAMWSALCEIHGQYLFWIGDALDEIAKRYGEASAKQIIKTSSDPRLFREALDIAKMFPANFNGSIPAVAQKKRR
jgi:hypothetical protein